MADAEQPTPVAETPVEATPVEDVEMEGTAKAVAGEDASTGLTEMEPEEPRLVLFAE